MYILYIYIYIRISCIYTCTWRNKTHHFRCNTKMPTTNSSPSSALAIKKKTKKNTRKEPKAFLESAKCFQCARCPGQKYRDVSSRQLTIAAFSLPKGSKVEHSWVLYTLQWGFGVANNKWFWNGPHAVFFHNHFHNHFHTNLQMKLSRAHKMHVLAGN